MGRNAVAFEVLSADSLREPGAYRFYRIGTDEHAGITFGCPCGCGARFGMRIKTTSQDGWDVTGEWPKVSATPSLGCMNRDGNGYHWHGYLRDGVFEEC